MGCFLLWRKGENMDIIGIIIFVIFIGLIVVVICGIHYMLDLAYMKRDGVDITYSKSKGISSEEIGQIVSRHYYKLGKDALNEKIEKGEFSSLDSISLDLDGMTAYNEITEEKRKTEKRKAKKTYIIAIFISLAVIVLIPFLMDHCMIGNSFSSNITNSQWVTFLGSYIGGALGGALAIAGVLITIRHYKKQEEQDKHTAVKPVLDAWHINGSCLRRIDEASRYFDYVFNGRFTHWINFAERENINEADWIHFELMIRNIGVGPAIEMKIALNTRKHTFDVGNQQIGIPRDSAVAYHIYIPKRVLDPEDNKLVFTFTDIYRSQFFKQEMMLDVSPTKDGLSCESLRDIGALTLPEPLERKDK